VHIASEHALHGLQHASSAERSNVKASAPHVQLMANRASLCAHLLQVRQVARSVHSEDLCISGWARPEGLQEAAEEGDFHQVGKAPLGLSRLSRGQGLHRALMGGGA
jgi:hypothetical protein